MKYRIDKEMLQKIKSQILTKMNRACQFANFYYRKFNNRQRIVWFVIGLIILLFVVVSASLIFVKHKSNVNYPIQFQTKSTVKRPLNNKPSTPVEVDNNLKLQNQLDDLKISSSQQFQAMQEQLQMIQSSLSSMPSLQDVKQLQYQFEGPNKDLLDEMNDLQNSMRKIVKQTAQKTWVNPKVVQNYFRLVAIQGFSDGMRAIIDIDGNQTALSVHELCPACRGWILQRMNFADQSAIFEKDDHNKKLYVKLQAN